MTVKFKVEGEIEIDLDKYDIKDLEAKDSETLKKAFLEELLYKKIGTCEFAGEQECNVKVDFHNLYVVKDWKYAGNMKNKNERYGSPLAITLDKYFPTTNEEVLENTMGEIGERKNRHSKKWK